MPSRVLLPLLLAALAVAGCGSSAPDPKPVAEAWLHALGRSDYAKACSLATPGVRAVLARYSDRHSERSCPAQARAYLGAVPGYRAGLRAARARSVTRSGARAKVTFAGGADSVLMLVRAGNAWHVAVPGLDERIFGRRMDASCLDSAVIKEYAPLAPGTLANLPAYFDTRAGEVALVRARFAAIVPPPRHADAMRRLLRTLAIERRGLRSLAGLARRGADRAHLNRVIRRVDRAIGGRQSEALLELRPSCGTTPGSQTLAAALVAAGAPICRAAKRAVRAIHPSSDAGTAADSLARIASLLRRTRRALSRLQAPQMSGPPLAEALRLTALAEREYRRSAGEARAYQITAARKSVTAAGRLSARASSGFRRVGLKSCAAL